MAGAAPPVAAYCAVTNGFDLGAALVMLIFALWQIPHFYSIAISRIDDYVAAGIPSFPVKRGVLTTKRQTIGYIVAFIAAELMLALCGYTGRWYLILVLVLGLTWLSAACVAYRATDDRLWGRRMFICSILAMSVLCIAMAVDCAGSH